MLFWLTFLARTMILKCKGKRKKKKILMRRRRKQKCLLAIYMYMYVYINNWSDLTIWPLKCEPPSFPSKCEGAVGLPAEYI